MQRFEIVEQFMDNFFRSVEGEAGVRNLEQTCEVLGYGQGWMRGRAIEEFLTDNPGAVEALYNFITEWAERNDAWAGAMQDALEQEGLLKGAE
jgi:hypothetical protein